MMKSDGNGGVILDKKIAVSLSLVILLIGALIPIIVTATNTENHISALQEKVDKNINDINNINGIVSNNEKELSTISTKLDYISQDLAEIKADLKELRGKE